MPTIKKMHEMCRGFVETCGIQQKCELIKWLTTWKWQTDFWFFIQFEGNAPITLALPHTHTHTLLFKLILNHFVNNRLLLILTRYNYT